MQGTHSSEDFLGILLVARADIRRGGGGCGDDGGKLWQRPQQKLVPGIAPTIPKAEVLRTREGAGAWKPRNIRRDRHYGPYSRNPDIVVGAEQGICSPSTNASSSQSLQCSV